MQNSETTLFAFLIPTLFANFLSILIIIFLFNYFFLHLFNFPWLGGLVTTFSLLFSSLSSVNCFQFSVWFNLEFRFIYFYGTLEFFFSLF